MKKIFIFMFLSLLSLSIISCDAFTLSLEYELTTDNLSTEAPTTEFSSNIISTENTLTDITSNQMTTTFPTSVITTDTEITITTEPTTEDLLEVSFDSLGGNSVDSIYTTNGSSITLPEPIRVGYTFIGWFTGEGDNSPQFTVFSVVTNNITLYARWEINQYTVDFETNGGSTIQTLTIDYDAILAQPEEPILEGYTFIGWYTDESLIQEYTFNTMPAEDITLYAKWNINQYTITYNIVEIDPLSFIVLYPGETIVQVSLGGNHSAALTSMGRLFMWGDNIVGQLGDGTTVSKSLPIEITSNFCLSADDQIIQISLGFFHSSALTSTGRLFMWGNNIVGQLGDGTTIDRLVPTEITSRFNIDAGDKVIQVALGEEHSAALTSTGRLFMWGHNSFGQLGDGTSVDKSVPTEITNALSLDSSDQIVQVSLGGLHSSALTSTGRLFMWGYNGSGNLGDGTKDDKSIPTEITDSIILETGDRIIQLNLGYHDSSILTMEGRFFMWGYNGSGQLGDGTTTDKLVPTEITSLFNLTTDDKIVQFSLGDTHSSALTSEGRLFMWGNNSDGQLGDGTTTNKLVPTEITSSFILATGIMINKVSLGFLDSAALTSDGRLFMWGNNYHGQLGDGTTTRKLIPTSLISYIIDEHEIVAYNYNETTLPILITKAGYDFSGWYFDQGLTTTYTFSEMPAKDITLYANWTMIEYNIDYNLDGGTNSLNNPSGYYVVSAFTLSEPTKEGYAFEGWYYDEELSYQASTNIIQGTTGDISLYAKWISEIYIITFDSNGGSEVMAITGDYAIEITEPEIPIKEGYTFDGWFTENTFENLYVFSSMPADNITLYAKWSIIQNTITYSIIEVDPLSYIVLHPGETIIQVSLGGSHSAALTSNGRLFMWGHNGFGNLGDGTTTNKLVPTEITSLFNLATNDKIVQVSLGGSHSAALTSDGRLFMWGSNEYGQLGDGTTIRKLIPTEITSKFSLGIGDKLSQVSLGLTYSSALTSDGHLFMWGDNVSGQLGDGTTIDKLVPTEITNRFKIVSSDKIIQVSLYYDHSAALTSNGRLFMWGNNIAGQLGDGTTENKSVPTEITSQFNLSTSDQIIQVSLGWIHSGALTSSGRIYMWGNNGNNQLGDGTRGERWVPTEITSEFNLAIDEQVIQISLGSSHSAALTSKGRLFTWGYNVFGQLGDGTTTDKSVPTEITDTLSLDSIDQIVQVSLGRLHSSALTSNGRLFTWGYNNYGQLGDGTNENRYTPNNLPFYKPSLLQIDVYGLGVDISEFVPTLEGYTFSGWYVDVNMTELFTITTMPAEDINLYGYWIPNE